MLNTDWKDDGESLRGCNWHGYAWGAECAWNASTTDPDDLQSPPGRRAVRRERRPFRPRDRAAGPDASTARHERDDERPLLAERLPRRAATRPPAGPPAERLLALVRPAIEHLRTCRQKAVANADLLDSFLLGARRMERIGPADARRARAWPSLSGGLHGGRQEDGPAFLATAEELVRSNRDAHATLGREFDRLWRTENKPYALKSVTDRYAALGRRGSIGCRAAGRRRGGTPRRAGRCPARTSSGLDRRRLARRTRPQKIVPEPLEPEAAWEEPAATHRLGLTVGAGIVDRFDLPVELDVRLPTVCAASPVPAFLPDGRCRAGEILAQLDPLGPPAKARLVLLLPGRLAKGSGGDGPRLPGPCPSAAGRCRRRCRRRPAPRA